MNQMQIKNLGGEVKSQDETGTFEGFASVFDMVDRGGDIVAKTAFNKTIQARKPKLLWQHDWASPIGRWTKLEVTPQGLRVEGKLNLDVQKGREAHALLKDGALDSLSIGYRVVRNSKKDNHRVLEEIDLFEISLVTFPMNEAALVDYVKEEAGDFLASKKREIETFLISHGFSRARAKHIAAEAAPEKLSPASETPDIRVLVRNLF